MHGHTGPRTAKELRYQCVVRGDCCTHQVCSQLNEMLPVCSPEERYQPLPTFPHCKQWKVGRSLGTRLLYALDGHYKLEPANPPPLLST